MESLSKFFARVVMEENTGCWNWSGHRIQSGYGRFWFRGKTRAAHRVAYELFVGPIDEGLTIDHLCRNRGCVNPAHLEPVPQDVNYKRGNGNQNRGKSYCKNGHPYSGDNVRTDPKYGFRRCLICRRADAARYRAKERL